MPPLATPRKRPPAIRSGEDALALALSTIEQLEEARIQVDVIIPGMDQETLVSHQRQNEQLYFIRYGYALAVIDYARGRGDIGDEAYDQLRARIMLTLRPTTFALKRF